MKTIRKVVCLLLLIALLSVAAACGGKDKNDAVNIATAPITYDKASGADVKIPVGVDALESYQLYLDGKAIPTTSTKFEEKNIILLASYLKFQELGEYTLKVEANDQSAEIVFTITSSEKSAPSLAVNQFTFSQESGSDLKIEVRLNNGAFSGLMLLGERVDAESYTFSGKTLTLKAAYLKSVDRKTLVFTLSNEVGSCEFTVTKEDVSFAPTAEENEASYSPDEDQTVTFAVDLRGESIVSLTADGAPLTESVDFYFEAGSLVVYTAAFETDTASSALILTTTGGSITLTVNRVYSASVWEGTNRVFFYSQGDLELPLRMNGFALESVEIDGWKLEANDYAIGDVSVALKSGVLQKLTAGSYRVVLTDENGATYTCQIMKGIAQADSFFTNFDDVDYSGRTDWHYSNTIQKVNEGIHGASVSVNGSGSVMLIGGVWVKDFTFAQGETYEMGFAFRVNRLVFNGTNYWTGYGVNDDKIVFAFSYNSDYPLAYVRQNDAGELELIMMPDGDASRSYLKKEGDVYYLQVAGEFPVGRDHLEVSNWATTDILMDDLFVVTAEKNVPAVTGPAACTLDLDRTDAQALPLDLNGCSVLAVYAGETLLTESTYLTEGDELLISSDYLDNKQTGQSEIYTVVTSGGRFVFTVTYTENSPILTGSYENRHIYQSGEALVVGLDFKGNALLSVKHGEKPLTAGSDYSVVEEGIRFPAVFLDTLRRGNDFTAVFEGTEIAFRITSNLILFADFDSYDPSEDHGYAVMIDNEVCEDGIDGKSGRITGSGSGTLMAFGGEYYPAVFEKGKTYMLQFDMKLLEPLSGVSAVVGNLFIPMFFGSGKDVFYISADQNGKVFVETQRLCDVTRSGMTMDAETGVYHFTVVVTPDEDCSVLELPVWMDCDFLVDNILFYEEIPA